MHHNGTWHPGDLTATRYEPGTGWWGMARFIVGVGMMPWHWKHEDELATGAVKGVLSPVGAAAVQP